MEKVKVFSFDQGASFFLGCFFENVSKTLTVGTCPGHHDAVVIQTQTINNYDDIAGTLDASYYKGAGERSGLEKEVVSVSHKVRKLTPKECERLQGFPDDWTATGIKDGKEIKISDTARYKACGNSMALPCVEFVMEQIFKELSNGDK